MAADFTIPRRPERRYPGRDGLEYEGGSVFRLTPPSEWADHRLAGLLEEVLAADAYTYGDWFDLPMPLYLIHDETSGDVFRASVRDGGVELHVLPETESAALRRLYERLDARLEGEWRVDCRTG